MIQLPNTTAETLGAGGVVKFRSPCPVIVEQVGVGNVATLTGNDTFTAEQTGEYLFENTCDCAGFYAVLSVGDTTDGCCVAPVTNPAGELLGITIAGNEYLTPVAAAPVTYTWAETNPNDGDGVVEWTGTPSDGSAAQVITIAEPTVDTDTIATGSTLDPATGIVTQTFEDAEGNALPSQTLDLSALIASDHPTLAAGTGVQVAFDAGANEWTISNTVVDTDTFSTLSGGTLTLPDGQTVDLTHTVDTDTFSTLSGNILTLPSGQTYDLTHTVDTDTFATLSGAVITFADGSTLDTTPTVDTFSTLSGSILTLPSGQTYDLAHTVDTDTHMTVVNNPDGSQSLQLVDIDGNNVGAAVPITHPVVTNTPYATAAANTIAEVNAGATTPVDFGSTNFLTTNRAVETAAAGVRNPSGRLGYFSELAGNYANDASLDGATVSLEHNGGHVYVRNAIGAGDTTPIVVPNGKYEGQTLILTGFGFNEMVLSGRFFGAGIRRVSDSLIQREAAATTILFRVYETLELVWTLSRWVVRSWDKNTTATLNWHEDVTGRINQWGVVAIPAGATEADVVLPVPLVISGYLPQLTAEGNDILASYDESVTDVYWDIDYVTQTGFKIFRPEGGPQIIVNWLVLGVSRL